KRRWSKEYQYFEIELPPALAEQRAIAQILSNMDAEIEALERKRKKYEMMKKGAMELLLTGKIRVEEVDGKIEVLK
ncbi:MAG: restriction endonuclease subunit S, partial [Sulfurovum sp.]|nr:restriction endonuclease subunit S [Sulfurovum sp.]